VEAILEEALFADPRDRIYLGLPLDVVELGSFEELARRMALLTYAFENALVPSALRRGKPRIGTEVRFPSQPKLLHLKVSRGTFSKAGRARCTYKNS